MQIEISSRCNLSCDKCHRQYSNRETGFMGLDTFKEIIDKLVKSKTIKPFLYIAGYGESLSNPNFWDMVKYAKRNECYLMLPTNGTTLTSDIIPKLRMIDSLQLSFDSFTINKILRDGSDDILKWIPELQRYGISTQLNVVIEKRNFKEFYNFLHYSMRHQVPTYFSFSTPLKKENKSLEEELKFCISKFNEMEHMKSQYYTSVGIDSTCKSFKNCRFLHNDFAIAWDGELAPCCDGMLLNYDFGYISDYNTLDDFFNSEIMQKIRNGLHPVCDYCKSWDTYMEQNYTPTLIYDKRLDDFRNIHKGKRCFILGNGPSLNEEVIEYLRGEITIGVNDITEAKDMWRFEPTYYAFADCSRVIDKANLEKLKKIKIPIFYSNIIFPQATAENPDNKQFTSKHYEYLKKCMGINILTHGKIGWPHLQIIKKEDISFDIRVGTTASGTVIQVVSIPLAAYMGCENIYLIGCDCNNEGHFNKNDASSFNPFGMDIIKQYTWYSEKLNETNQKLFNLSDSKLRHIPNLKITDIFN